ncbi:MAG: glycosyltransferase family 2 protein [Candidatus Omnitrophota bacterium]
MALVSIIIPAYNANKYIAQALESIAAQTYKEWELIVVEDGSKDTAEDIVSVFKKQVNNPVFYFKHETNKGLPVARNTGILNANGEFLAFLDADDYWDSTHLESIMPLFKSEEIGLVHSGSILFDGKTKEIIGKRAPDKKHLELFPKSLFGGGYIIQPSSAVVRKRVFALMGYFDENKNLKACEDLDLWIRIAEGNYKIIYSGKETCYYRKYDEAMSADSPNLVKSAGMVYLKHVGWNKIPWLYRHAVTSKTLSNAGRMCFRKDPKFAARLFFISWKAFPFNILNILYAAISAAFGLFKK